MMRLQKGWLPLIALALCACQGVDPYPGPGGGGGDGEPPGRSRFTLTGSFCATSDNTGPRTGLDLLVSNLNARVLGQETVPDSDADGLSDREADTDPTMADTDGDGLNDRVEKYLGALGLDPLRPDEPGACRLMPSVIPDSDQDGLNDCEETLLGSDDRSYDTDGDGYPDGIEFNGGTSYLYDDRSGDLDNDGISNGDEILLHLDPLFADDTNSRTHLGYRYRLADNGNPIRGMPCYDFEVTNISLLDTLETKPGAGKGWNLIVAIIAEWPVDAQGSGPRHRIAAVQIGLVSGRPEPSVVELQHSNFLLVE